MPVVRNPFMPALALLGVACFSTLNPALSASWQMIDSQSRSQTELDVSSVVRKDGRATGWVQTTYSKLTSTESGAYFAYRSVRENLRMNCSERTATVLERAYFNDEGTEIAMIKGKGETRSIVPDTTEQRVLARMCNPNAATASVDPAKIDAAKRAAGAPVAPAAAVRPVAAGATDSRYMDGPAASNTKSGFIKTKADAEAPAPSHTPAAKPDDAAAKKPAPAAEPTKAQDHPAPKAALGQAAAHAKEPEKKPAAAHAAPAARAAAAAQGTHVANGAHGARAESRQQVMARVLKDRNISPAGALAAKDAHGHGPSAVGAEHAHWAYDGEFAPYRWGDMKAEYNTCKSGTRQSPIDIRNVVVSEIDPIQFHYEDVPLKVSNNGHTIQVDYAPGSFILHGGARYELLQFHFHTPSEERINGRAFDMVAHLVHKSPQGKLAVVAVLLTAGKEQAMLQQIWNAMPGTPNRTRERLDVSINAKQLLPADQQFYSFMGSLTTPPCTEGVQWLVMKTPVELSRDQIGHFAALYPMNARPLQAQNDRLIKAGK